MSNLAIDFLMGMALSSVPIYVLTKYYFENNLTSNDFDLSSAIMYLPLKIGIINVIMTFSINKINSEFGTNPIVLGLVMSTVLSMLTKTFNEVPEKVIKMKNANMYHIYSMIVFIICYFLIQKTKLLLQK
jgi:hypothetical protein